MVNDKNADSNKKWEAIISVGNAVTEVASAFNEVASSVVIVATVADKIAGEE